jgi:Copper transport outer membrane protein, MctB
VGYSSRYHVASLAAVFLALGIGILIGTGLNGVVSDTTKSLEASLRGEIESSHDRIDELNRQISQHQSYEEASYPGLVRDLLAGRRVAVIALGGSDQDTRSYISQVVGPSAETGATVQDFEVVTEPPDLAGLADQLRGLRLGGTEVKGLAGGGDVLGAVAHHAGRALVQGGPLFRMIRGTLLKTDSGAPSGVDAVIVTRQQPTDLDPAQTAATAQLEAGLLDGLAATKLPVVGVETSTADPSSISLYSDHGISSVDDVDMYAGRVALAYALAGSKGAFGIKPSADRLLPVLRSPSRVPSQGARRAAGKQRNKP